jgi:hypothetical protein
MERSWSAATNADTIVQYEKFIRSYPDAKQVDEARRRITDKENAAAAVIRTKEEAVKARAATEAAARALAKEQAAAKLLAKEQAAARAKAEKEAAEREARSAANSVTAATTTQTSAISFFTPRRSRALAWAAAVAIVTTFSVGVYLRRDTKPPMPAVPSPNSIPTDTVKNPPAVLTTTAAPNSPAGTGQLVINAFPWGEVKSLKDEATNTERVTTGQPLYTPATLALPPGSYLVVLSNPNSRKSVSRSVTVKAGETVTCEAPLDTLDPNEYLGALTTSGQ